MREFSEFIIIILNYDNSQIFHCRMVFSTWKLTRSSSAVSSSYGTQDEKEAFSLKSTQSAQSSQREDTEARKAFHSGFKLKPTVCTEVTNLRDFSIAPLAKWRSSRLVRHVMFHTWVKLVLNRVSTRFDHVITRGKDAALASLSSVWSTKHYHI